MQNKSSQDGLGNAKCTLRTNVGRMLTMCIVLCCVVRKQKRERDGKMENRFLDALHFDASYGMFVHLIVKDNISIRYAHESVV